MLEGAIKMIEYASKEELKEQALKSMKLLHLHKNVINEFKEDQTLNRSEYFGALYWLTDEQKKIVKEFEEEYGYLVYHVILNQSPVGEVITLLHIPTEKMFWKQEFDDLAKGKVFAYVVYPKAQAYTEFYNIKIRPQFGGVVRLR